MMSDNPTTVVLILVFISDASENSDYHKETQQKWAAASLVTLACHSDVTQHTEQKLNILSFLFVHAFFKVSSPVSDIAQVKTKEND